MKPQPLLTARESATYALLSLPSKSNLVSRAREVRQRLQWPGQRLEEFRVRRARELLQHAATVPFYQQSFAHHGFDPAEFNDFAQLQQLPVLTREHLQTSFDSLRDPAATPDQYVRRSTGGTSGNPVTVLIDHRNATERLLINHRMYYVMGRRLGTRSLLIAGSPIDYQLWSSLQERVKNRLFQVSIHASFGLDRPGVEALIAKLQRGRFEFVLAYGSVFDILASYAEETGQPLRMARIVPMAELVTEAQRQRWRNSLGAEVFEIYGSREMGSIAGETPDHRHLLVNADMYHVEITDEVGRCLPAGEPGLITITNLIERSMPLIRYQLGDVGVLAKPSAGDIYHFPRLEITHGRVLDIVRCPDGKLLPGEFFPHLMKEVSRDVEQFQVVQDEIDHLVIKIVKRSSYLPAVTEYLIDKMQSQVGAAMRLDFEFVDHIESSASGKYRPTMSLIAGRQPMFGSLPATSGERQ